MKKTLHTIFVQRLSLYLVKELFWGVRRAGYDTLQQEGRDTWRVVCFEYSDFSYLFKANSGAVHG